MRLLGYIISARVLGLYVNSEDALKDALKGALKSILAMLIDYYPN